MPVSFEIEYISANRKYGYFVIARCLTPGVNFSVNENSFLNDIEIKAGISSPRADDKDGKPRQDLFIFFPKYEKDIVLFKKNMTVELLQDDKR